MNVPKQKKPSEVVSEFLDAMRGYNVSFTYSQDRQKKLEAEINDIEHRLELEDMSYHERAKLAATLADRLRERRYEKDNCENLAPIVKAFKDANQLRGMENALGEARKVENRLKNRVYKFKAKTAIIENGKIKEASP